MRERAQRYQRPAAKSCFTPVAYADKNGRAQAPGTAAAAAADCLVKRSPSGQFTFR